MKKLKALVLGYGGRGSLYASYAVKHPDELEIVCVADPNPKALKRAQKELGIGDEQCEQDCEKILSVEKMADVAFVCSPDRMHYVQAIALMKKKYHLLLEKPITTDLNECLEILNTAKENRVTVSVAHVLRYTEFYKQMRRIVEEGIIGDVTGIVQAENVGYWHYAHSFVRGNWRNSDQSSPIILQKCCHDFDIICYLTGKNCLELSSYGENSYFNESNAPQGSTEYCLEGCAMGKSCAYNAERAYIDEGLNGGRGWTVFYVDPNPTQENLMRALKRGPYGRCVFHCDNNVPDHQVVEMLMEDGVTAQLTMSAFSAECYRDTKIYGTKGELSGRMEEKKLFLRLFGEEEKEIDISRFTSDFSGHGGGDMRLVEDFLHAVNGEKADGLTDISKSVHSHVMAFLAEQSRQRDGERIVVNDFCRRTECLH